MILVIFRISCIFATQKQYNMENSIKTNIYGLDITITNNNIHI